MFLSLLMTSNLEIKAPWNTTQGCSMPSVSVETYHESMLESYAHHDEKLRQERLL